MEQNEDMDCGQDPDLEYVMEQETYPTHNCEVDSEPSLLRGHKAQHAADEKSIEGMLILHPRTSNLSWHRSSEDAEKEANRWKADMWKTMRGVKDCTKVCERRVKKQKS